eukprot:gene5956-18221_t
MDLQHLTETEARAKLAKAMGRLHKIKVAQRRYYDKKKDVICRKNRESYEQNKDEILAKRRELYNTDPARRQKRRERYLRTKGARNEV